MAMIAAAPVAEAAAGRAAAGTAAKRAGTSKAASARKAPAAKKAGARKAPAVQKPAAASGTAGVPTPPPPPEQMAADLLQPPGTKAAKNIGRSAGDAFKSATLKPPRSLNAKDASGFAFGLVLYAMALSGIKHGVPAGITGWLSAKFLNKPMVQ